MNFFKRNRSLEKTEVKRPQPVGLRGDFADAGLVDHEITSISAIPFGEYFELPDNFKSSYAAVRTPHGATLLVASGVFGGHAQWELHRRLTKEGVPDITIKRATEEVIRAYHDGQAPRGIQGGQAPTQIEEKGWALVDKAVELGASDIHIETRGTHAQVYFRIHGERVWHADISKATATEICNTLYIVHGDQNSKDEAWNPDTVKEAAIERPPRSQRQQENGSARTGEGDSEDKHVQLRFESTPIHPASDKNFQAVIRILVMEAANRRLPDVGYHEKQIEVVKEEMLLGAQGMVALVGPTNSGKSTSMQALMQELRDLRGPTIKAVTVEDPVEYLIPWASQVSVPRGRKNLEGIGNSVFNTFLKATLRLDPDIVMVGEIRDEESASNTKDLVLAGRKLLTTLHVKEVFAVFERLKELGVPRSVLYMEGFLSGVIYQRLVPVLCSTCSVPFEDAVATGRIRRALIDRVHRVSDSSKDNVRVRNHQGCPACSGRGIVGRTPCAELLVPDSTLLAHLRANDERAARAYWHSQERQNVDGLGVTAVAHAISKMRTGLLDPADIESQIGPLQIHYPDGPLVPDSRSSGYGFGGARYSGAERMGNEDSRRGRGV
ncbi:MAG: GspE/PulE family protein [Vicinamibacterales bacterium]